MVVTWPLKEARYSGLRPVSLALVESGVNEANAKTALESLRHVVSADVDSELRTATAVIDLGACASYELAVSDCVAALRGCGVQTEQVLERKDGAHNQYGLSEWLVVVAVGAAWTATAYAYLSSRVKLV